MVYHDTVEGLGQHGDQHANEDCDVGNVEHAEEDVAEVGGQAVVERLDENVVALAHRIEGVEHGYECGADSNEGAFG